MPTITITITDAQAACVAERLAAGTPRGAKPPTVQEWVTQQVLSNVDSCATQERSDRLSKLGALTDADIDAVEAARVRVL